MNSNPYLKILIALTGIFALLAAYSFYPDEIKLGSIKLKKADLEGALIPSEEELVDSTELVKTETSDTTTSRKDILTKNTSSANHIDTKETTSNLPIPKDSSYQPQRNDVDTTKQRFLLIGDSMLEGLRQRLNDYCKENGHTMNSVIWYSSSSLWYGNSDTIAYFIKKYKPTYVLICIGANELFIRNIKKDRANLVAHIVKQVGNLPYVWIGPPNWKADTGINDLILAYAGKDHYYESKKLKYQRSKDGAHPTLGSARIWMDSVATYIVNESCCPIQLKRPSKVYKGYPSTELLQPNPPAGL